MYGKFALVSLLVLSAGASVRAQDTAFFNGRDLTGWKGLTQHWSVKDGVLIGSTQPKGINFNTFLCSEREYGDFGLNFKVKLVGKSANSGVQIRSKIVDMEKFVVAGPQCDMGQIYWGSLYGEKFGGMMKAGDKATVEKVLKPDDFNDYSIRCVGKWVTIKINDTIIIDEEFAKLPEKGIIAFQLHGGPAMEAHFKDFVFAELK